ncbi:hypothetical protein BDD12DRAFT_868378 [Trichophaea hybrida]|nr:hypothetical protein BDD12DRAFT_868378 [Trichophaea hybrida]
MITQLIRCSTSPIQIHHNQIHNTHIRLLPSDFIPLSHASAIIRPGHPQPKSHALSRAPDPRIGRSKNCGGSHNTGPTATSVSPAKELTSRISLRSFLSAQSQPSLDCPHHSATMMIHLRRRCMSELHLSRRQSRLSSPA